MRKIIRLAATAVLLAALSLTAIAGEVGTGPLAPPSEPAPAAASAQPADETNNDAADGEVGTGPLAVLALIELLTSALP